MGTRIVSAASVDIVKGLVECAQKGREERQSNKEKMEEAPRDAQAISPSHVGSYWIRSFSFEHKFRPFKAQKLRVNVVLWRQNSKQQEEGASATEGL